MITRLQFFTEIKTRMGQSNLKPFDQSLGVGGSGHDRKFFPIVETNDHIRGMSGLAVLSHHLLHINPNDRMGRIVQRFSQSIATERRTEQKNRRPQKQNSERDAQVNHGSCHRRILGSEKSHGQAQSQHQEPNEKPDHARSAQLSPKQRFKRNSRNHKKMVGDSGLEPLTSRM